MIDIEALTKALREAERLESEATQEYVAAVIAREDAFIAFENAARADRDAKAAADEAERKMRGTRDRREDAMRAMMKAGWKR